MKRWNLGICASLLLTLMLGCERETKLISEQPVVESTMENKPVQPPPTPTSANSEVVIEPSKPKPNEQPAFVEDGGKSVTIMLEPKGFLKAPVMTIVANSPQTYAIVFREDMNRKSVEAALSKLATIEGTLPLKPELRFEWQNDSEIHLTVSTQSADDQTYPLRGYTLDVNGALTNTGKVLKDAPTFRTLVQKPSQLWRINTTDGRTEKLSQLSEPFNFQLLQDPNYLLAMQFLDYCECDATLPKLYSVYNVERDEMTTYPVPLMSTYKGHGDFIVDTRGFFYEQPVKGVQVPSSYSAVGVHIDGYVHGAALSHDRKHVLLAVGKETQDKDLDFVIYNLETKKAKSMSKKLIGLVPESEVSSAKLPVQFKDDGAFVYTFMRNEKIQGMTEYRYSWSNEQFETWKPPFAEYAWSGFMATDDDSYRFYYNGGLYRGNEHMDLPNRVYPNLWLHGTHSFVYSKANDGSPNPALTLDLYNVDDNKSRTIVKLPPGNHSIIGGSADGRWVYIFTATPL